MESRPGNSSVARSGCCSPVLHQMRRQLHQALVGCMNGIARCVAGLVAVKNCGKTIGSVCPDLALCVDCRLPIADCRLPIADCRLLMADGGWRMAFLPSCWRLPSLAVRRRVFAPAGAFLSFRRKERKQRKALNTKPMSAYTAGDTRARSDSPARRAQTAAYLKGVAALAWSRLSRLLGLPVVGSARLRLRLWLRLVLTGVCCGALIAPEAA